MGVTVHLREPMQRALEQLLGRPLSRVQGYATRARLTLTPLLDLALPGLAYLGGLADGQRGLVLSLITARRYGQHNTIVDKPGDAYRTMMLRDTILMNPEDLAACGLVAHQRITVQGEAGSLAGIEVIPGGIRRGAALMSYPEANVLMRAQVDLVSGTPAFKRVPVLVRG